ncbi:MAG: M20/M25/M40 family metallo-hydrolase [Anaerolineales bacterium]|nr:M20/M25/M40 family metallo-hydrolase [Chloroflexota bacterium]MBL6982683.1 M20/M25/M40 family metallo-hydrolase [Anaerolineales bacterium]
MDITKRVIELAIQIQQIPAPTFQEEQRAAFMHDLFIEEGLLDAEIDSLGNVYARLPGKDEGRSIVVSAHTDTVFPLETDLSVKRESDRIYAPGIGDNSLGLAGLLGLLWALQEREIQLPGDLWLVANVGEEGLGDLCGMRVVVDRFGDSPLAYIILEGMALGQIYHRGLGVQRYRITMETQGGHSWADYGVPSAIHELSALVTKLTELSLPKNPRTTLNVGVISGGTSINTIAPQASLELDLRSEDPEALQTLSQNVHALVEEANQPKVQARAEIIGQRPTGEIPEDHPLVKLAKSALAEQRVQVHLSIGSTDANIPLSRELPAVTIGLTTGKKAHTSEEFIETEPLTKGLAQLATIVVGLFNTLS